MAVKRSPDAQKIPNFMKGAGLQVCNRCSITDLGGFAGRFHGKWVTAGGRHGHALDMAFQIHPRLAAGGYEVGRIGGCRLLLKNSALFPWFILVPEVDGIEEPHELPESRYHEVMEAQRQVCGFVFAYFKPDKLNTACIGNQVRQMHFHVVGRSPGDAAWPGTVWAHDGKQSYGEGEAEKIVNAARQYLLME
ncbi:MAG: HIT domain-containing protein [Verrucomicrobiaceae bacterium]|nr:MAG: HIT domain-containing protein [Verrucomicrobiaceae bacterium]